VGAEKRPICCREEKGKGSGRSWKSAGCPIAPQRTAQVGPIASPTMDRPVGVAHRASGGRRARAASRTSDLGPRCGWKSALYPSCPSNPCGSAWGVQYRWSGDPTSLKTGTSTLSRSISAIRLDKRELSVAAARWTRLCRLGATRRPSTLAWRQLWRLCTLVLGWATALRYGSTTFIKKQTAGEMKSPFRMYARAEFSGQCLRVWTLPDGSASCCWWPGRRVAGRPRRQGCQSPRVMKDLSRSWVCAVKEAAIDLAPFKASLPSQRHKRRSSCNGAS
jgi:hypothetical protein